MDLHKPKPWHGLREFLKEYAIIVVGVLTALAAEQGVQALDWQRRVADAERDMRAELADDARFAYERVAVSDCATIQFKAIRTALTNNRDAGTPIPRVKRYRFPITAWLTDTWDNARGLQLTGHMPTARLRNYERAFFLVGRLRDLQHEQQALMPGIDTLATNGGRISPAERDRLFAAVEALEAASNQADNNAERFREVAQDLGVDLSAADKAKVVARARKFQPDCATVDPDTIERDMRSGLRLTNALGTRHGDP
jgi:hypothetical protein